MLWTSHKQQVIKKGGNRPAKAPCPEGAHQKNEAKLFIPGFIIPSMGDGGGRNQQKYLLQTDQSKMETKNLARRSLAVNVGGPP